MIHFSILVTTYNRPELLRHTLNSLAKQTYDNLTVYLLDNGSMPPVDTENIPRNLDIRCFRSERNRVASEMLHEALARVEESRVMWLADDDVLVPEALEVVAGCLRKHPEIEALSVGFSRFNHETCSLLGGDAYLGQFTGRVDRLDGYRAGLEYCRLWSIGKQLADISYIPKMAHPSASFFSSDLLNRTIEKQKEIFIKPICDVGYIGCNFNSQYVHYLDTPLVVLGESSKRESNGSKPGNRHQWKEFTQYIEYSPLQGPTHDNMVLESHLKVFYRNGINKREDGCIRPDFFFKHLDQILSDDPWTAETHKDLDEALPFTIQSIVQYAGVPKAQARSYIENWIVQRQREMKQHRVAEVESNLHVADAAPTGTFQNIVEFAAWQGANFAGTPV